MQRFRIHLSPEDWRSARRWTLASVGVYCSLLAGFILYVAFTAKPDVEVAAFSSTAKANVAGVERADKRPFSVSRRGCDKAVC
ncbi:hypothetical protein I6F35_30320 [Bradyrhizobium sp. BRP22]|uniref:hypothetical protein n=1 Tax=Bradyrhizobium sp. BRP22 TaxID=2793821 RepID=UPI001CD476D3|nr:hypothetical protein [Bradyrhizobium sp. BRP22]MCA1457439.1 hypothetical protein [Bradyrhizobium sp. BRP22]